MSEQVTEEFMQRFVSESNKIDPQPGHKNTPGDPHYDDHLLAVEYVVDASASNQLAHPRHVHQILMRRLKGFEEEAGKLRSINVSVGGRVCPDHSVVSPLLHDWIKRSEKLIRSMQEKRASLTDKSLTDMVWGLHIGFEEIHPFSDGNGRTGRLLMLNHAILLDLEPWMVEYNKVQDYYNVFNGGRYGVGT